MQEYFYELYNNFKEYAKEKNSKISVEFNENKIQIASKEMMSFLVSECLIEDVETVFELKNKGFSDRYTDYIIRNMCEQVIEYMYIMKHPELISEYFGEKINEKWNGENLFKGLKRTGEARFKEKIIISKMSSDIGERKSDKHKIALYDIYSVKAELEHHSYFHYMLNVMCDEKDKKDTQKEIDSMYLIYILSAFIKVYNTAV